MLHTSSLVAAALVVAASLVRPAAAAEPAAKPATPTHRVGLVPFRLEAKLEGVFESPRTEEVRIDPRRWTQLVVEEAVPHGTRVGKGDVLVRVETDKLDAAIRDLKIGGRIADVAHALLERELQALEKSTPRQLEVAQRGRRIAAEDLQRYEQKEQELAAAWNDLFLESAEHRRENADEELAQLEKMYEQDDLTEETEEIVLKRARFEADFLRFLERMARDSHDREAALGLPRALESIRLAAQAATQNQEQAEAALPLALDKLRLEVEKSTEDRRQAAEHLAELEADRRSLPVTAPLDGIVYYGRWRDGKWVDRDSAAQRLRPGGQLDPRETVLTIVGAGPLHLRAGVPEKELARVPVGAAARVAARAFPDPPLAGKVRSVSSLPVAPGRFEAVIDVADPRPQFTAGMEADVRVIADLRAEVLAVPRKAVFSDDLDDDKRYVLVVAEAGKEPVRRSVAVGRSTEELTEITAGLSVGEEILLEKPAAPRRDPPAAKPEPAEPQAEPAAKPDAAQPAAAANAPAAVSSPVPSSK